MSAELGPLLGRTLLLVAHPDDEAIGCGGLLQRIREPFVVFATDGGPVDPYFWRRYGSRRAYAELRQRELIEALGALGVARWQVLQADGKQVGDQELYLNLPQALACLNEIVKQFQPEALLTHAYEGGHPDHNACSFLAAKAGAEAGLPVWEFPLYHRDSSQVPVLQRFPPGEQIEIRLSDQEIARKIKSWRAYPSQGDFLQHFHPATERFRPQPEYDYLRPPHEGPLNYEVWGWKMTGRDVCAAFAGMLT